jgi:enamine deaminase RidA (YjgF/YER057c/UK114 family)
LEDGTFAQGVVGKDLDIETAQAHAKRCGLAILAALKNEIGDLDRVQQIVKLTGFVNCTPDFTKQPLVINGCSDLMQQVFDEKGIHARAAVGVNSLPLGFSVEIEAIIKIS